MDDWTPLMRVIMHRAVRSMDTVKYLYPAGAQAMVDNAMHYYPKSSELTQAQVQEIVDYMKECITDENAIAGS